MPCGPRRIPPVEVARVIGAGGHAVAAAQTTLRHLHDDAGGLIDFDGLLRADFDAGRFVLAVHAQDGNEGFAAAGTVHAVRNFADEHRREARARSALAAAGATLFSAAQATMHAPQPVQRSRSITMP